MCVCDLLARVYTRGGEGWGGGASVYSLIRRIYVYTDIDAYISFILFGTIQSEEFLILAGMFFCFFLNFYLFIYF